MMATKTKINRIDVFTVMICLAALPVMIAASGKHGRQQAKRMVCLANLRQLTSAWTLYAIDNDGKIINGDVEENSGNHDQEPAWVRKDWYPNTTLEQKKTAIKDGALYPYTGTLKVYKCPTGRAGMQNELRTYSIVDAMNCKSWSGGDMNVITLKRLCDISQPSLRFVFLDDGGSGGVTIGGWTVYVKVERWWDPPPVRHNDGTIFSFVDGHTEYWQWTDRRTIEFGRKMEPFSDEQPGNEDLHKARFASWGK